LGQYEDDSDECSVEKRLKISEDDIGWWYLSFLIDKKDKILLFFILFNWIVIFLTSMYPAL
jgi:hypothetical protein